MLSFLMLQEYDGIKKKGLHMKKHRRFILSLIILTVSFFCIRIPLLSLHGMKEWPFVLFSFSACLILTDLGFSRSCCLSVCTAAGYPAGFAAGLFLQQTSASGKNSLWIIWTCVLAGFILAGILLSVIRKKKNPAGGQRYEQDKYGNLS